MNNTGEIKESRTRRVTDRLVRWIAGDLLDQKISPGASAPEEVLHNMDVGIARTNARYALNRLGILPNRELVTYEEALRGATIASLEAAGLARPSDYAEGLKEV